MAHRILGNIRNNYSIFFSHIHSQRIPSQYRSIFATSHLDGSWMDTIKGVFTGKKPTSDSDSTEESFTLYRFADEMGKARKIGALKQYVVGRSSEATFSDAFEKQEAILRYLANIDPNGENLQVSQKQAAAKHCKCTVADIENTLAKFLWAREAQYKLQKLKDEGKPMPKSMAEVQKLMGSTPLDLAKSNMAESGQISRNAFCPCGSKKRYKRYTTLMIFSISSMLLIPLAFICWNSTVVVSIITFFFLFVLIQSRPQFCTFLYNVSEFSPKICNHDACKSVRNSDFGKRSSAVCQCLIQNASDYNIKLLKF